MEQPVLAFLPGQPETALQWSGTVTATERQIYGWLWRINEKVTIPTGTYEAPLRHGDLAPPDAGEHLTLAVAAPREADVRWGRARPAQSPAARTNPLAGRCPLAIEVGLAVGAGRGTLRAFEVVWLAAEPGSSAGA